MRKLLIILGIPIDDLAMPEALERVDEFIAIGRATGKSHQIATVNADFVVKSLGDPELRLILQEADLATADGMPLVWGARLLGVPLEGRVTGADLVPALAERAARNGYSLYLLGAAPGIAQRAGAILQAQHPQLKIVGMYSPPNKTVLEMDEAVVENIRAVKPDILLVAFGNPKQEKWISMHARTLHVPAMIGVGGTLDFIAGATRRAPAWMQTRGLEWIHRLLQEPRRLWKRYVVDLFGFGYFFARQWWALRKRGAPVAALPSAEMMLVNQTPILGVAGNLDTTNALAFSHAIERALALRAYVIVNLERATFIDSRGMGALVGGAKHARDAGGDLVLVGAPPQIKHALELARLDKFFELHDSVARALPRQVAPRAPETRGAWTIIPAPRRFDATTAPEFLEHHLARLAHHPRVILDFAGTIFLASAGMAALIKLDRQAKQAGGGLRIAGCSDDVLRVLKLTKLENVLAIFPNTNDALK
jgi:N-acetylglucosaminyldiphosphoundecaprenol N-acetyl-beta-D-mannosaminyltransferase